jgi:D-alanyl-D-alanine carboxypeptidase/D-alanyl-D-alanine-endopeptidase (penicillin-binding protein 4)
VKYRYVAAIVAGVVAFAGVTGSALAGTAPTKPQADTTLAADLNKILSDPRLANATSDVDVRTAAGASLYTSAAAASPVRPASNAKLFTTTTALDLLGPAYRFSTTVESTAAATGSTLPGNLVLRGTGDPTLHVAEFDALAARIAAKGITKVNGKLLADDTYFDSQRWNPHWDPGDAPFAYASEISALTVATDDVDDTGAVQVTVTPAAEGQPAVVALSPDTGYVKVTSGAKTGAPGSANTIVVDRPAGANTVTVTGSIPAGGAALVRLRTVQDPALFAASIFRAALAKHGVTVAGTTDHGTAGAGCRVLAARQSAPLSDILTPYLKLSNDGIADILTKTIGRKVSGTGSWAAGTAAIKNHITSLGVNTAELSLVDGSGLSNDDRASARGVADLLVTVRSKSWFALFYGALPIAGQSAPLVGGTLAARMVGTKAAGNVHGKTGTLTGATSLSGYVTGPDQQVEVFSILLNNYATPTPTDLQDRIAIRLATGPAASTLVRAPAHTGKEIESSWSRLA